MGGKAGNCKIYRRSLISNRNSASPAFCSVECHSWLKDPVALPAGLWSEGSWIKHISCPDQLQLLALLLRSLPYWCCFRAFKLLASLLGCKHLYSGVLRNCSLRISGLSALEQSERKSNALFTYSDFFFFFTRGILVVFENTWFV